MSFPHLLVTGIVTFPTFVRDQVIAEFLACLKIDRKKTQLSEKKTQLSKEKTQLSEKKTQLQQGTGVELLWLCGLNGNVSVMFFLAVCPVSLVEK